MNNNNLMSSGNEVAKYSVGSNQRKISVTNNQLKCASQELTDSYEYAKNLYTQNQKSTIQQIGSQVKSVGNSVNDTLKSTTNAATQIQQRIISLQSEQPVTAAEQAFNNISGFISYFFNK